MLIKHKVYTRNIGDVRDILCHSKRYKSICLLKLQEKLDEFSREFAYQANWILSRYESITTCNGIYYGRKRYHDKDAYDKKRHEELFNTKIDLIMRAANCAITSRGNISVRDAISKLPCHILKRLNKKGV